MAIQSDLKFNFPLALMKSEIEEDVKFIRENSDNYVEYTVSTTIVSEETVAPDITKAKEIGDLAIKQLDRMAAFQNITPEKFEKICSLFKLERTFAFICLSSVTNFSNPIINLIVKYMQGYDSRAAVVYKGYWGIRYNITCTHIHLEREMNQEKIKQIDNEISLNMS